jgi:hypothetical protein
VRFLRKAIGQHGVPAKITVDKSAANTTAIASYNLEQDAEIELRQVNYLNNVVEQDHRAIKRQVRPMMGFKSFWSAAALLAGIELIHMIRKGQLKAEGRLCPASASSKPRRGDRCYMALDPKWAEAATSNEPLIIAAVPTSGLLLITEGLGWLPSMPRWAPALLWAGFLFFPFVLVLKILTSYLKARE